MRVFGAFAFLWLGLMIASAEGGRDFAGRYAISNIVESDHLASATLTVRFFNYTGADIKEAHLLLIDPLGHSETELAVNLRLGNHSHKKIRTDVSVTASELHRWQKGSSPQLVLEYQDDSGQEIRRAIELLKEGKAGSAVQ
jgi:hypothetical protein